MSDTHGTNPEEQDTCGHGEHWTAVGIEGEEAIISLIQSIVNKGQVSGASEPFTPNSPYKNLIYYDLAFETLKFTAICGLNEAAKELNFLSAFPVMTRTSDWLIEIKDIGAIYGDNERVIAGELPSEHALEWFVPYFGMEANRWQTGETAVVALAALALSIAPFDSEPITLTEGPVLELMKERLREEGNAAEADKPDYSVTIQTDTMRTIYSDYHDHAMLIGEVTKVDPLMVGQVRRGWILKVECLRDQPESGYQLPLYLFEHLLETDMQTIQVGDVIQCSAWLQGSWKDQAQ